MRLIVLLMLFLAASGCAESEFAQQAPQQAGEYENSGPIHPNPPVANGLAENGEPSHITVQHILIAYAGSIGQKSPTRSIVEAEKLAKEVFEEAKTSEDFDAMVEKYTDDSHPGIYKMANFTFAGNREFSSRDNWIHERGGMVPAFGNVGFQLKVGEVGMSAQDVKDSPYGWHIIKRLE